MDNKDFLLEIGVEEIPAGYIANAMQKIDHHFKEKLNAAGLKYKDIKLFSTPRRFAIKIAQLQTSQEDQVHEKVGPSLQVAYDDKGELTNAAAGFLKSSGAQRSDIYIHKTPKGDKIAVKFEKKGADTEQILSNIVTELIDIIPFPKNMRWKSKGLKFARPIRWLLILWGDKILDLNFNNLKSENKSYGNRFLSLDDHFVINDINSYEEVLESFYVIPYREKRRKLISDNLDTLFKDSEFNVKKDDHLLEIVTDLVEYPVPVIAEFNEEYLKLPEKIITSTLSQHQKYFSVEKKDGSLVNKFVFISNGDPKFVELIREGNEKVIKARLDDAEFFYNEDIKVPFENFVEKLKEVTFQQKLGNVFEKMERIISNTEFICDHLKLSKVKKENSLRAAKLCKADLVTLMMGEKEFTKLQGYIGWKYAEHSKEKEPVAKAIFEHYLPRWQNDILPSTKEGSVVSIADKIDTICGIIGVGMIPTGSKDPFALRRAANGVVQVLADNSFNININDLLINAFNCLKSKIDNEELSIEIVREFIKQRINWFLKEKGIDYDVIESVIHIDHNFVPELWDRARALQELQSSNEFIELVTGFKRVSNIIEQHKEISIFKTELLEEKAEIALFEEYKILEVKIAEQLQMNNYNIVLKLLIEFGKFINKFFDDVLVNTEPVQLKENRYALLLMIRKLFLQVADLSKIVIEGIDK